MTSRGWIIVLKTTLICAGLLAALWSLPRLGFGFLGVFFVIADVGVDEHRRLVAGLLGLGLGALVVGVLLIAVGIKLRLPLKTGCTACGYDTRGLPANAPCPECGQKP